MSWIKIVSIFVISEIISIIILLPLTFTFGGDDFYPSRISFQIAIFFILIYLIKIFIFFKYLIRNIVNRKFMLSLLSLTIISYLLFILYCITFYIAIYIGMVGVVTDPGSNRL